MSLIMRVIVGVASVWLSCGPAVAQRYVGPNELAMCWPPETDHDCFRRIVDQLPGKFGVETAEVLAAQGREGVRVYYFDAFGVLWPMVSMTARPGERFVEREARLEVKAVLADGRVAVLGRPAWYDAYAEAERYAVSVADRSAAPDSLPSVLAAAAPGLILPILPRCMDPPTIIIESILKGQVHRWSPKTCRTDPLTTGAIDLYTLVAASFAHCGHFDVARYGYSVGRMRACLMTDGPKPIDAVEVLELLRPNIGGDTRVPYAPESQAEDVTLTVDGRTIQGREAVIEAMKAGALGKRWLQIVSASGDDDGVRVRCLLRALDRNRPDPVPLELLMRRDEAGGWRIVAWTVERRDPA